MTKILVVDDHAVVRQGVKQILNEQFQGVVIGEARNAEEMMDRLRKFAWDIVILDVGMRVKSGLDAIKDLKQVCPKLPVLVLSAYPEDQLARRMLKAGAAGYLTKDSAPNELVHALRKILGGGKFVSASMAELLVANLNEDAEKPLHELLPVLNVADNGASVKWLEALGWTRRNLYSAEGLLADPHDDAAVATALFATLRFGYGQIFLSLSSQGLRGGLPVGPGSGDDAGATWMYWYMSSPAEVDEIFARATAAGFTIVAPPEAKPWGEHELRIAHPDGHVFRVAATITAP